MKNLQLKIFTAAENIFQIETTSTANTFTVNVGATSLRQYICKRRHSCSIDDSTVATITNAVYNNVSGELTVTTSAAHGRYIGNFVFLKDLCLVVLAQPKYFQTVDMHLDLQQIFVNSAEYMRNITVITKGKTQRIRSQEDF